MSDLSDPVHRQSKKPRAKPHAAFLVPRAGQNIAGSHAGDLSRVDTAQAPVT